MNRWKIWSPLAAAVLLAACSSPLQPTTPSLDGDLRSNSVAVSDEDIARITAVWTASDGYDVEFLGTGMGNQDDEIDSAELGIAPADAEKIHARATIRFVAEDEEELTSPVNGYTRPTSVVFTAYDTGHDMLATAPAVGVPSLNPDPAEGEEGIGGALIYQAEFAGTIDGRSVAYVDVMIADAPESSWYENRAFELYVLRRSADATVSVGGTSNEFVWWSLGDNREVGERAIDLPADFAGGSVPVTFSVTDVEDDHRVVVLQVTDGSTVLAEELFTRPGYYPTGDASQRDSLPHGVLDDELLIATLEANVPAGAGALYARVISPDPRDTNDPWSGEGDSVIFSAVTAQVELEEPEGGEGCTPGYWRQEHHYDSWIGYAPGDSFDTVFGVTYGGTLGQAVQANGGGRNALARHAVAALLNAANPDVSYAYSASEIIALVQGAWDGSKSAINAVKDDLDAANNAGCELN